MRGDMMRGGVHRPPSHAVTLGLGAVIAFYSSCSASDAEKRPSPSSTEIENPDGFRPGVGEAGAEGTPVADGANTGIAGNAGTATVCTGCLIDGVCHPAGERYPGNSCAVCMPDASAVSWSSEADGSPCADGSLCTSDDRCQAGRCTGEVRDCADDRACTTGERCDDTTGCVAGVSSCPAGESCLPSGECGACAVDQCNIDGSCYAALAQSPTNPCQLCAPANTATAWSLAVDGAPCDDASACTSADACVAGFCAGSPQSCDDGIFCNGAETCAEVNGTCEKVGGVSPCTSGCAESQHACSPLVPECIGQAAGTRFCFDRFLYACGPDSVEIDVEGVETCVIECQGEIGNAHCAPQDDSVVIEQVWPASNVGGGAVLIAGRNLQNVREVWFQGVRAPVLSHDSAVPGSEKLIAELPEVQSTIEGKLRLVTTDGISESLDYLVSGGSFPPGPAGPSLPVGNRPLAPNPTPDPEPPPTYPPISDFWVNECDPDDIYFLQEPFPADEVAPLIRPFTQVDNGDPDQPPDQGAITGFIDMQTLLVHMTVTNGSTSTSYIGVYSDTGRDFTFRLILFPEAAPGRQLVLSVSEDGSEIPDQLDPEECQR